MFISKENYKSQMGQSHLDELSRMVEEDYKKTVKAFSNLPAVPSPKNYHAIHSDMFIRDALARFCEKYKSEGWSQIKDGQNWYLLHELDQSCHVHKIRCEPEIDLQKTLRRTNRSINSDIYITNNAASYLNDVRGKNYKNLKLRERLMSKYSPDKIHFFFLTWSENQRDNLNVGVICQDENPENSWYLPASYSTTNNAETHGMEDIAHSPASNEADIVKPKIRKDVSRPSI